MLSEALKVILKEVVVDPDKEAKWEALTMIARSPGVFRSRTEMEQAAPEAIAYVSKVLLENEPKWWTTLGKYAGIGLAASGVALVTSPIWLQAVGFTAAGIAALSLAASFLGPATVAGFFCGLSIGGSRWFRLHVPDHFHLILSWRWNHCRPGCRWDQGGLGLLPEREPAGANAADGSAHVGASH